MSPSPSPFIPRVFSRPTEKELARLTRSSSTLNEDHEARRSTVGLVFTAPTTVPIHPALSTTHEGCLCASTSTSIQSEDANLLLAATSRIDDESQREGSSTNQRTDGIGITDSFTAWILRSLMKFKASSHDFPELHNPANDNPHGLHREPHELSVPLGGLSQLCEGIVIGNDFSLNKMKASHMSNISPPEDDSDLEWDQPGAFDFLANIEIDNLEISDNDTRSSGYTELSPLRPRRLYETVLLNRATYGRSPLRKSAVRNDDEDITDRSSIADANDISQHHADLEDELDGNNTDEDDDDSDYEYSSACFTLSASDGSDDGDFFDASSDSEAFGASVR